VALACPAQNLPSRPRMPWLSSCLNNALRAHDRLSRAAPAEQRSRTPSRVCKQMSGTRPRAGRAPQRSGSAKKPAMAQTLPAPSRERSRQRVLFVTPPSLPRPARPERAVMTWSLYAPNCCHAMPLRNSFPRSGFAVVPRTMKSGPDSDAVDRPRADPIDLRLAEHRAATLHRQPRRTPAAIYRDDARPTRPW